MLMFTITMFIALPLALTVFVACSKTETTEKPKEVKYTCYSEIGIINLSYIDQNRNGIDTVILKNNYSFIAFRTEANYGFATKMKSYQADSMYLKAELDGKKIDDSARSLCCTSTVAVQLSNIK